MSDRRPEHRATLMDDLVILHHADRPAAERRGRLLTKLRHPAKAIHAASAIDGEEPPDTTSRRALTLGVIAAAGVALLLWVERSIDATQVPDETTSVVASAVQTPAPGDSCVVATGSKGLLWDASTQSPDLPRLDGRSGRWLHHWDTPEGNQRSIPNIIPFGRAREKAPYTLGMAGAHTTGWGAKLGTALRVHAGGEPDAVRFQCYDASAYAGVKFRARGTGIVFVLIQTENSIPEQLGGRCRNKCWFTASHALALTDDVREYRIEWDRFSAGTSIEPPQSQLMMLEFLVTRTPEPYEIELEAVAFMTYAEARALRPRSKPAEPRAPLPARTR